MKQFLLIIIIGLLRLTSFSQDSLKHQAIEINIGMNHLIGNSELLPKPGFGVSLKYIWFTNSRINLVSGILFEKTKYYEDNVQCGHFCHYKNMTFNIYSFSIPILVRANTGKHYKVFFELGPSFDIIPIKWGKGTKITYSPPDNPTETAVSGDFDHNITDFGLNMGIGLIVPINKRRFIVMTTYHNSIKSVFDDQANENTEFISIKLGILIN